MENKILYIDLETTDLCLTTAKIVQIGLIYNGYEKSIILNPEKSITNSWIHGITDDIVRDKPIFKDISLKLLKLINESDCLIGYNIKNYDWNILYIEFLRCGIDVKKPEIIDIYEMVKEIESSKKLKDVYLRFFKENFSGQHNALHDIKATARIYEYLMKEYYFMNK